MVTAIHSVADARRRARRILPRVVFDYVDGGAQDEVTMARNEQAFRSMAFRPRMAVRVEEPDLRTTVLGAELALPVLLAPCGLVRLLHPEGAAGAGRAAASAGTIWVLSTVAGVTLEEAAAGGGRRWFQLYAPGGRPEAAALLERAEAAGYEALVVTVDTPALGNRERDVRNGVAPPLRLDARTAVTLGPQVLARPRWALRMMRSGVSMLGDQAGDRDRTERSVDSAGSASRGSALGAAGTVAMLASPFTWDDVAWMRGRWRLPLIVKGVLSAGDARLAVNAGADAVIVSNHGGRQLDGAPATLDVLPDVVAEVGAHSDVLVDGGVRRGGDVIKALALGARAVLVGRPYLYGLAADGEQGVARVLDVLRAEMVRDMRLLGCGAVAALDGSWLERPGHAGH